MYEMDTFADELKVRFEGCRPRLPAVVRLRPLLASGTSKRPRCGGTEENGPAREMESGL
jgi:hypothetical protein